LPLQHRHGDPDARTEDGEAGLLADVRAGHGPEGRAADARVRRPAAPHRPACACRADGRDDRRRPRERRRRRDCGSSGWSGLRHSMRSRRLFLALVSVLFLATALPSGQSRDADGMLVRIRTEGFQRSRALALYRTLTDDIGARLTGSPAHMKAARWAVDRLAEWGLADPHLEPYEFGRGWQVDRVSVEMTEPRYVPLIAYPDAWSPATAGVVSGPAVYVGDKTASQVEAMAAQLRGAIVLTHLPQAEFVAG